MRILLAGFSIMLGGSRRLDLVFDIDLGDLVEGHHVVARGMEMLDSGGVLHYEFVPGVRPDETEINGPFFWYTVVWSDSRPTAG
ncbi:hypothetical protein ACWDA3_29120 [Nonomuraea rubra]